MTETLLSWGVRPHGVTRFCEAPGITTVGGTKNPDLDAIEAMDPDLVLMDEEENRRDDAVALKAAGVPVLATAIRQVKDVRPALEAVAEAIGVAVPNPPDLPDEKPGIGADLGVYVPIWRRPWMTIGQPTYASSLLASAGLVNVFGEVEEGYPIASPEEASARHPDFVLAPSEPYRFSERHRGELEAAAPAIFVDGRDLFWWGSRTPAALVRLRQLAAALRPR